MKIAIPVDQNNVLDAHFGHCRSFLLFDVVNKNIIGDEIVIPPPHEPGLLPRWLARRGVTHIIAGGIGQRALQIFSQEGINALVGAPNRNARDLAEEYLSGALVLNVNYCDH